VKIKVRKCGVAFFWRW